jgi:hypothetical protein
MRLGRFVFEVLEGWNHNSVNLWEIVLQMNRIQSNSSVFEFDLKLFRTKLNSNKIKLELNQTRAENKLELKSNSKRTQLF